VDRGGAAAGFPVMGISGSEVRVGEKLEGARAHLPVVSVGAEVDCGGLSTAAVLGGGGYGAPAVLRWGGGTAPRTAGGWRRKWWPRRRRTAAVPFWVTSRASAWIFLGARGGEGRGEASPRSERAWSEGAG